MKYLSLIIYVMILFLVISMGFAACKPTNSGNFSDISSILNNESVSSTQLTVSTGSVITGDSSSVTSVADGTSDDTVSLNLGDNVFVDDWD